MMSRRVLFPRILMLLYICTVAFLCFHRFSSLPSISQTVLGIPTDKIVHFIMFFPFPVLTVMCIRNAPKSRSAVIIQGIMAFLIGCLFAILTEYIQTKLYYRSGDILDFAADAIALALASVISFSILAHRFRKNA